MDTSHYGPSLAALVSLEQIDDNKCVWYNKKKIKNKQVRCGNTVKDDVDLRVKSVKRLQRLISFDNNVKKWIFNDIPAIIAKLKEVSQWMLCKNAKHRKNSSSIYERWV